MKFLAVIGSLGVMVSGATPVPHPALFLDLCVVLTGDLARIEVFDLSTYCIPRMALHPFRRLPLSWSFRGAFGRQFILLGGRLLLHGMMCHTTRGPRVIGLCPRPIFAVK